MSAMRGYSVKNRKLTPAVGQFRTASWRPPQSFEQLCLKLGHSPHLLFQPSGMRAAVAGIRAAYERAGVGERYRFRIDNGDIRPK